MSGYCRELTVEPPNDSKGLDHCHSVNEKNTGKAEAGSARSYRRLVYWVSQTQSSIEAGNTLRKSRSAALHACSVDAHFS